jgi:hypothetical protein
MNAVHGRDEIKPFVSSSRGTYAELAIEEPAPVIAHPRRFGSGRGRPQNLRYLMPRIASGRIRQWPRSLEHQAMNKVEHI